MARLRGDVHPEWLRRAALQPELGPPPGNKTPRSRHSIRAPRAPLARPPDVNNACRMLEAGRASPLVCSASRAPRRRRSCRRRSSLDVGSHAPGRGSRAALRLQPPVRHVKGQCSLPPLHRRVEWAAARGDLDECRRLLRQPEALPSLVTEVERARVSGGRRVATRVIGALTGYWLWNATAWAYAYRVLGAEAERLLAERDHQGGPSP